MKFHVKLSFMSSLVIVHGLILSSTFCYNSDDNILSHTHDWVPFKLCTYKIHVLAAILLFLQSKLLHVLFDFVNLTKGSYYNTVSFGYCTKYSELFHVLSVLFGFSHKFFKSIVSFGYSCRVTEWVITRIVFFFRGKLDA